MLLYRFGEFDLDTARCALRRAGVGIDLEPKPYAVLVCLLENPDRRVSALQLARIVWGNPLPQQGSILNAVTAVRRAIGRDLISHKRPGGYQLTVPVTLVSDQLPRDELGHRTAWRYYAARAAMADRSSAQCAQIADHLLLAERERFGP